MMSTVFVFLSVLILYYLILIPLEYRSLKEVRMEYSQTGTSHDTHGNPSFEKQLLETNKQGNLLNVPAVAIAVFIYKARHRDT